MNRYRATRFINKREAEYCEFESTDDATAQKTLIKLETEYAIDWETAEDSDCTPASSDVTLFIDKLNVQPIPGASKGTLTHWVPVTKDIELASQKPYSGAAVAFVKKVAGLLKVDGQPDSFVLEEGQPYAEGIEEYYSVSDHGDLVEELHDLILEARKLCGMED